MSDQFPKKQSSQKSIRSTSGQTFPQNFPFSQVLESIDNFFNQSKLLKPSFKVNVSETEKSYRIQAELPGVKKEHIAIQLLKNSITIKVKNSEIMTQTDENNQTYKSYSSYQEMSRTIPLYHPINERNAKASYRDGLLTVIIYKLNGKTLQIDD